MKKIWRLITARRLTVNWLLAQGYCLDTPQMPMEMLQCNSHILGLIYTRLTLRYRCARGYGLRWEKGEGIEDNKTLRDAEK